MSIDRTMVVVAALLGIVLSAVPAHSQWGQEKPPAWGQLGPPAWGQYQGKLGAGGWQYNKVLQPNVPPGAIQSPNEIAGGPGTGALFTPPDTRLLGRTVR